MVISYHKDRIDSNVVSCMAAWFPKMHISIGDSARLHKVLPLWVHELLKEVDQLIVGSVLEIDKKRMR